MTPSPTGVSLQAAPASRPAADRCCSSGQASGGAGAALSECSSSGWSETCMVEQPAPWSGLSWPAQAALHAHGVHSGTPAVVQPAAEWRQQEWGGPAAAPAAGQPLQLSAGPRQSPTGNHSMAAGYQQLGGVALGGGSFGNGPSSTTTSGGSLLLPSLELDACAAGAAAADACAPAADDLWDSGLELVLASSARGNAAPMDEPIPLHLTDAGLDALLAPFEDWSCPLHPAPSAGALPPPELQLQPTTGSAAPAAAGPQQGQQAAGVTSVPFPAVAAQGAGSVAAGAGTATSPSPSSSSHAVGSSDAGTSSSFGGKAPRQKGGRPRLHHPTAACAAPAASAPAAAGQGAAAAAGGLGDAGSRVGIPLYKKGGRGPKPKYIFGTREEAEGARRERNRKTALESYYKKKEHTQRLQAELAALQAQNSALERLLWNMNATGLCPLPEASNDGIDLWLKVIGMGSGCST